MECDSMYIIKAAFWCRWRFWAFFYELDVTTLRLQLDAIPTPSHWSKWCSFLMCSSVMLSFIFDYRTLFRFSRMSFCLSTASKLIISLKLLGMRKKPLQCDAKELTPCESTFYLESICFCNRYVLKATWDDLYSVARYNRSFQESTKSTTSNSR